ncbi:MAG: outer membrane beta-barrel protein [Chitinophagales bacterium]
MKKNEQHKNSPDNLFKDELENRSFRFEEEYWTEAKKKIEEYEQSGKLRYKKPRVWWWLGSGIALLAIVSGFYLFSGLLGERKSESLYRGSEHVKSTDGAPATIQQQDTRVSSDTTRKKITSDTQQAHPDTENLIGVNDAKMKSISTESFKNSIDKYQPEKKEIFALNVTSEEQDNVSEEKINFEEKNINSVTQQTEKSEKNNAGNAVPLEKEKSPLESMTGNPDSSSIASVTPEEVPTSDSVLVHVENSNPLDPAKKLRFSVGLHFGYEYVTKNISANAQSVYTNSYFQQRNNDESPVWVPSVGILAGIDISNFNLTTGFTSYQLGEKINYSLINTITDSLTITDIITTLYIDTTDILYDTTYILVDSMLVIDSIYTIYFTDTSYTNDTITEVTYFNVESTSIKRDTNLVSYFEIPLLFGYQFSKGYWRFNLQTGPSLGIYRFSSGSVIESDLESLAPLNDTDYFTKLSYNWLFTPSVTYILTENLQIGLQPRFRFNLNSIAMDEGIKLRYQTYGLHVNAKYRF